MNGYLSIQVIEICMAKLYEHIDKQADVVFIVVAVNAQVQSVYYMHLSEHPSFATP